MPPRRTWLHAAWTDEKQDLTLLAAREPERDTLRRVVALEAPHVGKLENLAAARDHTARVAERAATRRGQRRKADRPADQGRDALFTHWGGERDAASAAARVIREAPGRLGFRCCAVARAGEQLTAWADRWRLAARPEPRSTGRPFAVSSARSGVSTEALDGTSPA